MVGAAPVVVVVVVVVAAVVDICSDHLDERSVDEETLVGANDAAGEAASSAPVRERTALTSFMLAGVLR